MLCVFLYVICNVPSISVCALDDPTRALHPL